MNIYVSHSSKYNYIDNIYAPIKNSDLPKSNTFFLPHKDENTINTKNIISNSDLVIAEISLPSISQGIELGWADYANIPILCIYEKGKEISSSLKFITNHFIEYDNIQDMIEKISNFIAKQEIENVLKKLYKIFNKNNCFWILTGSTSLRMQEVNVPIKKDIDILTDANGSHQIDQILSQYCIQPSAFSSTQKYQSYFGIYEIDNVKIEVMGEFQYRLKNGQWSIPNQKNDFHYLNINNMSIPVLSLEQELQEYSNTDRLDKVEKIKEKLQTKYSIP